MQQALYTQVRDRLNSQKNKKVKNQRDDYRWVETRVRRETRRDRERWREGN